MKRSTRKALNQTAKVYRVAQKEMERDMQEAIEAAFRNPAPTVQARLKALFPNGKPTPDAFVATIVTHIKQQQKKDAKP
ncbi:MAG: sporulation initiation factor Spo0A C-terminal domain-containing protein [Acetanaerobacterium sp.]